MDDEYINKQLLLESMQKSLDSSPDGYAVIGAYGFCVAMQVIDKYPAADVQPVRHGRWINICGDSESLRQCSECLQDFDYIDGICYLVSGQRLPNYCPNCGAKMDGGDQK